MLLLDPTPFARGLAGKKVEVVNYPDGRFAVRHKGVALPFRVFDKIQTVPGLSGMVLRLLARGRKRNSIVADLAPFAVAILLLFGIPKMRRLAVTYGLLLYAASLANATARSSRTSGWVPHWRSRGSGRRHIRRTVSEAIHDASGHQTIWRHRVCRQGAVHRARFWQ